MYNDISFLRRGYGGYFSYFEELNKIDLGEGRQNIWDLFPSDSLFHAVLCESTFSTRLERLFRFVQNDE